MYKILKKGCGEKILSKDQNILITYSIFDTEKTYNFENSEPCSCCLNDLLPSLGLAMIGMEKGEIRKIYIHPSLAYGTSGPFPPNSLFVANIELVNVDPEETSQTAPQTQE